VHAEAEVVHAEDAPLCSNATFFFTFESVGAKIRKFSPPTEHTRGADLYDTKHTSQPNNKLLFIINALFSRSTTKQDKENE
jgi:hypothetical protein